MLRYLPNPIGRIECVTCTMTLDSYLHSNLVMHRNSEGSQVCLTTCGKRTRSLPRKHCKLSTLLCEPFTVLRIDKFVVVAFEEI